MQRQLNFGRSNALDRTALLGATAVDALDAVGANEAHGMGILADDPVRAHP
ncbi:hypothetical protein D3C80_2212410 [compost metagenome]